jgi:hypothetical protein
MNFKLTGLVLFSFFILSESIVAQEDIDKNNVFYIGVGSSSGSDDENDDTPWSLGFLHNSPTSNKVYGFDVSGEGTMLDSTYGGYDDLAQGFSFNFLYGIDVSKNQNDKISVGLLIGLIEEEQDCPDSYLGYQCYADESPDTDYGFNGGGFINYSVNESLNLGLRATSNSTQLTIGFKF